MYTVLIAVCAPLGVWIVGTGCTGCGGTGIWLQFVPWLLGGFIDGFIPANGPKDIAAHICKTLAAFIGGVIVYLLLTLWGLGMF